MGGAAPRGPAALLCATFFVSGAAALVFETLWFRQAGLAFGNGLWASALVLSSFMAGLALGNGLAARLGHRVRSSARLYAKAEALVALSGVLLVFVLPHLGALLAPLWRALWEQPLLLNGTRLGLAFVLLLVPSTAMGLTLPLLVRALSTPGASFGNLVGRLYGWNTLGALAGVLLVELVLLEAVGVHGAALCAAGLNGLAVCGALLVARRLPASATSARPARVPLSAGARRCLAAAFVAGLVLLGLEVVWFRFLQLFMPGTTVTFAALLALVLAGIGLGSLVAARMFRRFPRLHEHDASLALVLGAVSLLVYLALDRVITDQRVSVTGFGLGYLGIAAALMLPVCAGSGALFTLLGQRLHAELGDGTRSAGLLTLANTLGAALGPILAGFVLLPTLGMEASFFALSCAYGLVALLLVRRFGFSFASASERVLAGGTTALVVALVAFPFGPMDRYLDIATGAYRRSGVEVVARHEGVLETMQYLRRDYLGEPHSVRLVTNCYSMAATEPLAQRYMKQYVLLPRALHPGLRDALQISFGTGSTAQALVDTPSLASITIVDISADVFALSDVVFPEPGSNPLEDPRVEAVVEDGRFFLQTTDRTFDLITSEPPPPKMAGVVSLYTRDYFRLIHDRLRSGGMATYWLPVAQLTQGEAQAVIRAFLDVFGDGTSLWTGTGMEWMLLGTKGDPATLSLDRFEEPWRDSAARAEWAVLGFERPAQLAATFLMDAPALRAATEGVAPLTDDRPKRLSGRFGSDEAGLAWFAEVLDAEAARERFAASDQVRRLVPTAVREEALGLFEVQGLLNRMIAPELFDAPVTFADIDHVLRTTDLQAPVLWPNASDGRRQEILARALAAGSADLDDDRVQVELGVGCMARRDFRGAARAFARADALQPRAGLLPTRVYLHALLGEHDEARRLLDEVPAAIPDEFRRWVTGAFPGL